MSKISTRPPPVKLKLSWEYIQAGVQAHVSLGPVKDLPDALLAVHERGAAAFEVSTTHWREDGHLQRQEHYPPLQLPGEDGQYVLRSGDGAECARIESPHSWEEES